MNASLEIGPDVAAVLRPEETARLEALRDARPLRCVVCGRPIEPGGGPAVTVSLVLEGDSAVVQFAHSACAPSRADLAQLVTIAQADPLGIAYAQAMHPQAGAVLLWERRLDVRVHDVTLSDVFPYLDARREDGFHPALADEPVHPLPDLRLAREEPDLVLLRDDDPCERFHDAMDLAPDGWMDALERSGFALLIAGAQIGLDKPSAGSIQRAIRAQRALMGLVAYGP
jgi:ribosomal protein L24E